MRHLIIILSCILIASAAEATPTYNYINLGTLGGTTSYSQAWGINNRGQVVGQASTSNGNGWYHAVLFSGTGSGNIDLGTLGGAASAAYAINDSGTIVGSAFYTNDREYATRFATGGNIFLGERGSVAYDINNAGQIVGGMTDAFGRSTAATFHSGQVDIAGLGFYPNQAYSINNGGQIVGESRTSNFDTNAFGATVFNGTIGSNVNLGGLDANSPFSHAFDNNDSGQSVGRSQGPGNQHATLFRPGGNVNLDPEGRGFMTASGINNHGQIVGGSFYWESGQLYALSDIVGGIPDGWLGLRGDKINDWGQIAATVVVPGQGGRALLLNPAEPNVFATSGGGLDIRFVGGMDYSRFEGVTGLATRATFLAGEAGSGGKGAFDLNRSVNISFSSPNPGVSLVSDIVSVEGTEYDTFVLSLSYGPGHGSVALSWRDESDGTWKLAVEGNSGVRGALAGSYDLSFEEFLVGFNHGEFDASLMLGAYGSANGNAWAVLNHNSDFGVSEISVNHPPVANAGTDQTVAEGAPVILHGEDSFDIDADSFTYAWVQIENGSPAGPLTGANTANPTFTAPFVGPNGAPGPVATLVFELRVDDGYPQDQPAPGYTLANVVDRVTVDVVNVDHEPVANAGSDFSVNEAAVATLDGRGSMDPDGDTLTFAWAQTAGGTPVTLVNADMAQPTFVAPNVALGGETVSFELTLTANGTSSTDTVSVTIVNVNHPPVAQAGVDRSVAEGSPVTLHGEDSFDIDLDRFTSSWVQVENGSPAVTLTGANTANPTFTAPFVGASGAPGVVATLVFELRVDDGYSQDEPAPGFTFENVVDRVTVEVTNVNNEPTANAGLDHTVEENSVVSLNGTISGDPDGDTLTYAWVQVANGSPVATLTGAATETPAFTAPFVSPGGADFEFELTVDDGFGGSATDRVLIHVQNVNDPPLATAAQPTLGVLWPPNHSLVSVGIMGISDPNGDPVTVTITGVTQDEPTNGLGDGDTGIDAVINADGTVLLRAERSGTGDGRVYRLSFTATDGEGSTSGVVKVRVPKSKKTVEAIDSSGVFDSTD